MNSYNEDAIFLSEESTRAFVSTLLFDKESLSLRDNFISDIEQNITFLDNGDIVVDVPDIDFVDVEDYVPVKAAVSTKEISIVVDVVMSVSSCYTNVELQNSHRTNTDIRSKYAIGKKGTQWNTVKVA